MTKPAYICHTESIFELLFGLSGNRRSLRPCSFDLIFFAFAPRRQSFSKLFSSLIMWRWVSLDADVQGDSSTAAWWGAYLVLSWEMFVKSKRKWSRCDLKLREKQRLGAESDVFNRGGLIMSVTEQKLHLWGRLWTTQMEEWWLGLKLKYYLAVWPDDLS